MIPAWPGLLWGWNTSALGKYFRTNRFKETFSFHISTANEPGIFKAVVTLKFQIVLLKSWLCQLNFPISLLVAPRGKRGWKTFYAVLKGTVLYLQKVKYSGPNQNSLLKGYCVESIGACIVPAMTVYWSLCVVVITLAITQWIILTLLDNGPWQSAVLFFSP